MKTRHWQRLSDVTSVTFDLSLRTLTLNNILDMELHRFGADIEEIVNEASQEGKIENELNKIESFWQRYFLETVVYKKDGVERGLVLRPSEELELQLDDNMV
jgi:dynein heavy chain